MKTYLITIVLLISCLSGFNQTHDTDWYNKSWKQDGVYGISADKFYSTYSDQQIQPVIVAVIDDGVDIYHEDFEGKLWLNEDEIPDNGLDDDGNGYVDDVYGWNFLGNSDGENIIGENLELTRLFRAYKEKFNNLDWNDIDRGDKQEYAMYLEYKSKYEEAFSEFKQNFNQFQEISTLYKTVLAYFSNAIDKYDDLNAFVDNYQPKGQEEEQAMKFLKVAQELDLEEAITQGKKEFENGFKYHYNLDINPREIVDDTKSGYGNNMVWAENPDHGTHVAGIIGAVRGNDKGVDGIAANALIMSLRAVPDGDERDLDVANAIRYAVDNGAGVINMSFGKSYSPKRELVDEAIAYAKKNDVLMICAAGNDAIDKDIQITFPDGTGGHAESLEHWLTVGASDVSTAPSLLASFSNFGYSKVDLIAPGVDILSLAPGNQTQSQSGTSMASPVVAGMAAVLRGMFPEKSAAEIKLLIIQSLSYEGKRKVKAGQKSTKLKKVVRNPGVPSLDRAVAASTEKATL